MSSSTTFTYAITPALKRQALAEFIGRIRQKNPGVASTVQRAFGQHDYARIFDSLVRGDGLAGNDLANSMAAYTILGWGIANGNLREPSRASVRAVRAQVAAALAGDPNLTAPGRRAKLGEEFKILLVTLHSGLQSVQREGRLREFSGDVAQMLRAQSGRDPRSVRLTDDGIVAANVGIPDAGRTGSDRIDVAEVAPTDPGLRVGSGAVLAATIGGAGLLGAYIIARRSA